CTYLLTGSRHSFRANLLQHVDIVGTFWKVLFFQWVRISNLVGICSALNRRIILSETIVYIIAGAWSATHEQKFGTGVCDLLPPCLRSFVDTFRPVAKNSGPIGNDKVDLVSVQPINVVLIPFVTHR